MSLWYCAIHGLVGPRACCSHAGRAEIDHDAACECGHTFLHHAPTGIGTYACIMACCGCEIGQPTPAPHHNED